MKIPTLTILGHGATALVATTALVVATYATTQERAEPTSDWSAAAAAILQEQVDALEAHYGTCTKTPRLVDTVIVSNAPRTKAERDAKVPPRHDTAVARVVTFDEAYAASMARIEAGLPATIKIWSFC